MRKIRYIKKPMIYLVRRLSAIYAIKFKILFDESVICRADFSKLINNVNDSLRKFS